MNITKLTSYALIFEWTINGLLTNNRKSLSKRQKEILEEFGEIEKNKTDPTIKNFFEKAKKFWKSS